MPTIGDKWFGFGAEGVLPCYIPDFQRDYSWGPSTSKTLIEDLISHIVGSHGLIPPNELGDPRDEYHAGHILTFTDELRPIVDGQQRLTTLTLAACALRDISVDLDFWKIAYDVDRQLIWGSEAYGQSTMFFRPKDKTHVLDNMNPKKILLNKASIDYNFDINVIEGSDAGNNASIDVEEFVSKWKLRENVKIQFSGGAILTLTNPYNQGTPVRVLTGNLAQAVADGETGIIKLGEKKGTKANRNSNFHKTSVIIVETINDFISDTQYDQFEVDDEGNPTEIENGNHIERLNSKEKRCREFLWALKSVSFKNTNFGNEGQAVRHFLITNSASHKEDLSTFDMLRAKVIEARDGNPRNDYTNPETDDYHLYEEWKRFRDSVEREKPEFIDKFFQNYVSASNTPKLKTKFASINVHSIAKHYDKRTQAWDKVGIKNLLTELREYYKIYDEIKKGFGEINVERHLEEFLVIINTKPWQQWYPLYMASRRIFANENKQESIVSLLKVITRIYAKSSALQNLTKDTENVLAGGEIYRSLYTEIPNWIRNIHALKSEENASEENDNDVNNVINTISQRTNQLLAEINWDADEILAKEEDNPRIFTKSTHTEMKFIFSLIEKNLGGLAGGGGRFKENLGVSEIEHILPNSLDYIIDEEDENNIQSKQFEFDDEEVFDAAKLRLGNRLLFPKKANNHLDSKGFIVKISDEDCNVDGICVNGSLHYENNTDTYPLVASLIEMFYDDREVDEIVWNQENIEEWEEFIVTAYVDAVNAY